MGVLTTIPFLDTTLAKDNEVIFILRQWLQTQKHLPEISDEYLQMFYEMRKPSIERTKEIIDSHFTIKTFAPEIFSNRIQTINNYMKYLCVTEFKEKSKNGNIIIFSRLKDNNIDHFNFDESVKSLLIYVDAIIARQKTKPKGEKFPTMNIKLILCKLSLLVSGNTPKVDEWCIKIIIIMDMAQLSLSHLSKINLITFKKFIDYLQKGLYFKLNGIHIINKQSFTDKLMFMIKPFLNKNMIDLIHFHGPIDELENIISIEHFPNEYGGQAQSIFQSSNDLYEFINQEMINWFVEEAKLRVNEFHRPSIIKGSSIFGIEGSIRKLEID